MAVAGLFSLLLTWWSGPIDTAAPIAKGNSITFLRLGFVLFPTRGVTPLGYAAFAFALGVTAGVLLRRTVPAMAATLATFLFIQIAWPIWVRPHLIPPAQKFVALTAAIISNAGLAVGPGGSTIIVPNLPSMAGDWIISTQNIDPGRPPVQCEQRQRLPGQHLPGMRQHAEQSPPQGRDRLPARQSLLGPPVVRDRHLPGRRAGAGRVLLLVDPVAPSLTVIATNYTRRNCPGNVMVDSSGECR